MKSTQSGAATVNKRFFSRSFLILLSILLICSVFFCVGQIVHTQSIKNAVLDTTEHSFNNAVSSVDRYFEQLGHTCSDIVLSQEFAPVVAAAPYDPAVVMQTLRSTSYGRKQNEFTSYLNGFYLLTPQGVPHVLGADAVYPRETFFSFNFHSPQYSEEFWMNEMSHDFTMKFYPSAQFDNVSSSAKLLVPIAYKIPESKNFLLVSLVDVSAISKNVFSFASGELVIKDSDGNFITPCDDKAESLINSLSGKHSRADGLHVFHAASSTSGISYYYIISSSELFHIINFSLYLSLLISLIFILLMIFLIFMISKRWKTSFARIASTLDSCSDSDDAPTSPLAYIEHNVNALIEKNAVYASALNEKDSVLKSMFLQSRLRDIYVNIEDAEKQLDSSSPYVMVYMRVNYKDAFYSQLQEEQGKSTFLLKQLIELYLSSETENSVTFQMENDQIISIISVTDNNIEPAITAVENSIKKLENESEYVFFTIVMSQIHNDISDLKSSFDYLSDLANYASPVMETQLLREGEVKTGAGHFYFTIEQMEKLSSLMLNCSLTECIRSLNEILDYNIKKEINGFDLYLLCTEIVNCSVKLLNRLFHTTPPSLALSRVYADLDRAVTVQQYQKICAQLIEQAVDYIRINKRDEDYIISFILDYIEKHYSEDIYLNLFAEKLNLTEAYISSYFKKKMNVKLSDYINSFRIKKAIALIENPQNKNKEIAALVGLPNVNTFIRLFRKYTGYTPGEYKKIHFNDSDSM